MLQAVSKPITERCDEDHESGRDNVQKRLGQREGKMRIKMKWRLRAEAVGGTECLLLRISAGFWLRVKKQQEKLSPRLCTVETIRSMTTCHSLFSSLWGETPAFRSTDGKESNIRVGVAYRSFSTVELRIWNCYCVQVVDI